MTQSVHSKICFSFSLLNWILHIAPLKKTHFDYFLFLCVIFWSTSCQTSRQNKSHTLLGLKKTNITWVILVTWLLSVHHTFNIHRLLLIFDFITCLTALLISRGSDGLRSIISRLLHTTLTADKSVRWMAALMSPPKEVNGGRGGW